MKSEKQSAEVLNRRMFLSLLGVTGATLSLAGQQVLRGASPGKNVGPRTINLFSKHLGWMGYEEFARTTKEIGFDGGHVEPERVAEDLPRAVRAIREAGLEAPMMTTVIADAGDPLTEEVLRVASDLGMRYYRMDSIDYDDSLRVWDTLDRYQSRFRKLAELNRKYDIHGPIKTMPIQKSVDRSGKSGC